MAYDPAYEQCRRGFRTLPVKPVKVKYILRKIKSNECMKSEIIIAHYGYIVVRIDGEREKRGNNR